ncbi:MAG: DUF4352 domain-containing protein [Candidatus Eremiobacteraeota bacterium]|nr:DUF4352 domain-containing protein [Candidatus Eremiobacteraeota bacterium]
MRRALWTVCGVLLLAMLVGCSHKETTTEQSGSSTTTEATATAEQAATSAPASGGKQDVAFTFNDVAVTTSGAPVLRLGFDLKNNGQDPLLCEEDDFSLQLSDGSSKDPDSGAENNCNPDTIDPGSTAKVTMFFDLPSGYTGPVTLVMSENGSVVGRGTTQVQ